MKGRPLYTVVVTGVLSLGLLAGAGAQQSGAGEPDGQSQQMRPHGPPSPARELERLTHELTLTAAQQSAILPILEKRQEAMRALRQSAASPEDGREQARTMMEGSRASIRVLLTPSQQQQFDAMRPPHRPGGGGADQGPPPAPPTEPQT